MCKNGGFRGGRTKNNERIIGKIRNDEKYRIIRDVKDGS